MNVEVSTGAESAGQLDVWIDRLIAYISALDAIDADKPATFLRDAWDIWENAALADPPATTGPGHLLMLGVTDALAYSSRTANHSYDHTQNRPTLATVHAVLTDDLNAIRTKCERWRLEGLPSAEAVAALSAAARKATHRLSA